MTEGLFILTTIFVAYVVYAIIGEQKATAKSKAPAAKPEAQAAVVEQPKPQAAVAKEKPAAATPKAATPKSEPSKSTAAKPAATKPAAPKVAAKPAATKATAKPASTKAAAAQPAATKKAPAAAAKSAGLKDPKTGEVVTAYSNYRFTKRWIKDALVAEGLLEKVYTGNELNADTEAKIKAAIGKLEAMDKYKA
jgi:outer membrane biosynthesis protein TonB